MSNNALMTADDAAQMIADGKIRSPDGKTASWFDFFQYPFKKTADWAECGNTRH
jgi:hypothetical protein